MTLFSVCGLAQDVLGVFVADADSGPTNIRSAPRGVIALSLPDTTSYILAVSNPTNGWWLVESLSDAEHVQDIDLTGSSTGKYWIHHSVIGLGTRNYGGQKLVLRSAPSAKARATYSFTDEKLLHPIDVRGSWVKVKTADGKHTGWIEEIWLCDNPLTNCC